MLEITRVDVVDGQTLDIELSNGHLVLFDMRRLMEADCAYDALRDLEVLPRPGTDGSSVYWREGPSISLDKIMALLNMPYNNQK